MDAVSLSGMELSRELAKALGWRIECVRHSEDYALWDYHVTGPDGQRVFLSISDTINPPPAYVWERAHKEAGIPLWHDDTERALAVCLKIGHQRGWDLVLYSATMGSKPCTVAKFYTHDVHPVKFVETMGYAALTPAEALSRLALAALQQHTSQRQRVMTRYAKDLPTAP